MTDIAVVGLGPAGLDRVAPRIRRLLLDEERAVVVRTADHPAAAALGELRSVAYCDDLYDGASTFEDVYAAIADRVLEAADHGPVTYAVPGSAVVGERAVAMIRSRAAVVVEPGESFLDLACAVTGVDPIGDGLQVVDGRALPDPLPLHVATFITQVDAPHIAADVAVTLGRVLPDDATVVVLERLGDGDQVVEEVPLTRLSSRPVGPRTTVFVRRASVGWLGLVETNRRLRRECPWDREQTHHTLLSQLVEEAYETVDAVSRLPSTAPAGDIDFGAYAVVEEELGDLLLQVVFHATLAREAGAFDVDEVAEAIRRKLVRRHPHVFSDVEVNTAGEVIANWEALKREEKERSSLMDDIPTALPGIHRADKLQRRAAGVGFDWPAPEPVFDKVAEELDELRAEGDDQDRVTAELGDVLFSIVNLARHLGADPEIALARANEAFADRFRAMERLVEAEGGDLRAMTLDELDDLWDRVKG